MKSCVDSEKEKQMTFSLHSMDRIVNENQNGQESENKKQETWKPFKKCTNQTTKPENISPIVEGTVNKKNKSVQRLLNQSSFKQQIFSEHLPCPGLSSPWKTSQTGCLSWRKLHSRYRRWRQIEYIKQCYFCSFDKSCLTFCQPHGLQHTRLPCTSLSPRVCSNSCPLSRWYIQPSYPLSPPSPPALNLP